MPPLFSTVWRAIPRGELDHLLAVLAATPDRRPHHPPPPLTAARARVARLAFWGPGWRLVDVAGEMDGEPTAFSFLAAPEGTVCTLLDGAAPEIHRLNAEAPLRLKSPALTMQYIRFFCAAVWGADGPFIVVESAEAAARWLSGLEAIREDLWTSEADDRGVEVALIYGRSLYRCRFEISPHGGVSMLNNDLLGGGLPTQRYDPPYRYNVTD